jgi:hypothetical protein
MARLLAGLMLAIGAASAAGAEEGYKLVTPQVLVGEQKSVGDIWVLHFKFRGPRYIMATVPGKGRKLIWYMTYEVVNRTGKPRLFIPQFTLVTDTGKAYQDVILPQAEKAVSMREDPTEPLMNSVTISEPIPPTPAESLPITRRGVVFFEDVDLAAKSFTVFVTGLSNAYTKIADPDSKEQKLLRKTLKIEFLKPGDIYAPDEKEIKLAGYKWTYR